MPSRTPVVFTLPELWLLQAKVRHEMAGQGDWKAPPTSQPLNEQVIMAILFCEENESPDACLELTAEELLVIDYVVPQEAKDAEGRPLGKPILRKTFVARRRLAGLELAATAEHPDEGRVDIPTAMDLMENRLTDRKAD